MSDSATGLEILRPKALEILSRYDEKSAAVLTLLHLACEHLGQLNPEAEQWTAGLTGVPIVHVRQVSSFYSMYKHPCQKHLRVCTGLSCALSGGQDLLRYLKSVLAKQAADGKTAWTLEEAECLCACEKAPMLQVDGENVDHVTEQKIDEILKSK